jgi:signal transduction histidine kinase
VSYLGLRRWATNDRYGRGMNRVRVAFDALIVVASVESALEVALRQDSLRAPRSALFFAVPAIVLVIAPLLARHRLPFAVPLSVWFVGAALSFVDGRLVVFTASAVAAGMAAAFLLGNLRDPFRAKVGLAVVLGGSSMVVSNDPDRAVGTLVFVPVLFAIGWLAGFALRERVTQAEAAEERAAHAERQRAAATRIAAAEERARIARELHDIVAHAVSVMVLQVGAVRHKLPDTLAEETDALRSVERAGRTALTEMRRLLDATRRDGEDAALTPHPGLDNLEALAAEVQRAGLAVRLHIDGAPFGLPEAIDLSAYRIVQEGLTNALKHARASRADVTVRYRAGAVEVEVRDDGTGAVGALSEGEPGRGLAGIRERVTIYGGEMTAGAAPDRGFLLSTRLPVPGGSW